MTPPDLSLALERELLDRYGPLIGNKELQRALGYPSAEAFRQALAREQVPVPVFVVPQRRGKFALTSEVARWLAQCRAGAKTSETHPNKGDPLP